MGNYFLLEDIIKEKHMMSFLPQMFEKYDLQEFERLKSSENALTFAQQPHKLKMKGLW